MASASNFSSGSNSVSSASPGAAPPRPADGTPGQPRDDLGRILSGPSVGADDAGLALPGAAFEGADEVALDGVPQVGLPVQFHGAGDVAGLEVEVLAAAGEAVAGAGIDEQAVVIAHVIDGGHGHLARVDLGGGTDGEVARAGQRGIAQVAPIGQAAVEDADVVQAGPAQGPPRAAGE